MDLVSCEGQVLHHAQHLAQDHAVLRPQAPRMHRLQCAYNPSCKPLIKMTTILGMPAQFPQKKTSRAGSLAWSLETVYAAELGMRFTWCLKNNLCQYYAVERGRQKIGWGRAAMRTWS